MKIAHLCFVEPYLDNWSYQANLLPEYQAKLGHDVVVIAGQGYQPEEYNKYKEVGNRASEYQISRVRILRLPLRLNLLNRLVLPKGLKKALEREKPDLIFMHSLNNLSVVTAARYKRRHGCLLYADAHAEWANSGKNFVSLRLLHGFFWRAVYCVYQNRLDRFFAITEDCAKFAHDVNGILRPIELLNLGADTDAIRYGERGQIRSEIRGLFGFGECDFVVATAGKINGMKQVDVLIEAVRSLEATDLKVLIIGPMEKGIQERLESLASGDTRIVFAGWQDSRRINDFFLASDIAAFPGSQSVIWQQAVCCGLPAIFRWWGDTVAYLDRGNAIFLKTDDPKELADQINRLMADEALRAGMSAQAMELCNTQLSYNVVARRSLPGGEKA